MTDADDALKALKALGWHPGYEPKGIKHDECAFLYADGTLQAGGPPRRAIYKSADMVASESIKVETSTEYPVAWRKL